MAILLLIILLIVVGSEVVYKDNFAIITGTITGDGTTNPSKTINYPIGFNRDNCIVLTVNFKRPTTIFKGYGSVFDSSSYVAGSIPAKVSLGETDIGINIRNINVADDGSIMVPNISASVSYEYTIILMKIN